MATIANLLVRLGADFGDAPQKVQDLHDGMDDLGHSADDAGHRIDDLGHHAHESGEGFEELREHLLEAGKELIKMGAEALELTGIFETLKESLEISAEVESVEVAITQLAGSVDKASDMIDKMEALSKAEALRFPEVEPAAQHFMALGFSAEQTVPAIAAAGNASWALGMSLESVTQRMGMMVMGGMVSGRYLRSIGVSLEDLAATMGITGDNAADLERKVREAFKFEDEEDRLNTLVVAMQKFGGMGAKEADTLTGHWIEMKNAWHEAFKSIGDDLNGLAKQLTSVGTQAAEAVQYMAANSLVDLRNNLRDLGLLHSKYEDHVKVTSTASVSGTEGDAAGAKTAGGKAMDEAAEKDAAEAAEAKDSNAEKALDAEIKRAATLRSIQEDNEHAGVQAQIAAMHDRQAASVAAAEEELRVARQKEADITADEAANLSKRVALARQSGKDKSIGEDDDKLPAINAETAGKVAELRAASQQRVLEAQKATSDASNKLTDAEAAHQRQMYEYTLKVGTETWDSLTKTLKELEGKEYDFFTKFVEDTQKIQDIKDKSDTKNAEAQAKGAGDSAALGIARQKIELEGQYASSIGHTAQDQIAYARQLASFDSQERAAKLVGIQKELSLAQQAETVASARSSASIPGTEDAVSTAGAEAEAKTKVLELQQQINDLTESGANADLAAQQKITDEINKQNIGRQIATDVYNTITVALPQQLGQSLSAGIFGGGKKGEDVGKQVGDALKNVGKQLLGEAFTQIISKLIEKIVIETGLQAAFNALFPAVVTPQVAATTANTAALVALTAATTASAATSGAGAAVGAGGAAAGALANVATAATPVNAAASIIGPVIGGVISGVISAVATFIGDASIVGAINKTTAAVYSLRTSGVASSSPTGAPGAAGGQPAQTPPASSGFFANMASSLLDAFTAADAIPVKIMAINPGIVFASVSSMFGFASGGPVPYDMVAQVHAGEHVLNADQVAGLAPLPDLPAFSQYGGVSRDQGTAISSQSSNASNVSMSGPMHFHGVQNVRQLMKEISEVSKNASPAHSPLGR